MDLPWIAASSGDVVGNGEGIAPGDGATEHNTREGVPLNRAAHACKDWRWLELARNHQRLSG